MARKMTEWPSKCGPITKIMQSDGCKRDTVPVAVGQLYNFYEFGCHLGNVGLEERDYRVPPGSGHNKFYRPAKFTNLTPRVIEALYCTGR